MINEDIEVDDILSNLNKSKKIKSGQKGKRGEREIVDALNERFKVIFSNHPDWGQFSRSVASGARWGQNVILSKAAMNSFSGDITCPEKFLFVIESKIGYNDIDLYACFTGKCRELDNFLTQVSNDSERCGRHPMLIWKKDRKEKLVFVKKELIPNPPSVCLYYGSWIGVSFDWIMSLDDSYFFDIKSSC